jgi:hypothetical protein
MPPRTHTLPKRSMAAPYGRTGATSTVASTLPVRESSCFISIEL